MRISVISSEYPPDRGGVSGYTRNWALAMTALGHHVTVITSPSPGAQVTPTPGVDVVVHGAAWGPRDHRRLRQLLVASRPDVVVLQYVPHAYSPRGGGVPVALLLARTLRGLGVPLVVNGHELAGELLRPAHRIPWKVGQRLALALLIHLSAYIVVTVSSRRDWLERRFPGAAGKAVIIPIGSTLSGVPTSAVEAQTVTNRRGDKSGASGPVSLGSMGMGHPTQQVEMLTALLDAVERAGIDARLSVVGQLVVPDPRVQHLGYLDDADVVEFLASLDLFVLPISDGFSGRRSAPISALGAGTPVLTTWAAETDRVAYPVADLALVPSGDPGAFAARAAELLSTPGALDALGRRWQATYARDFAWPVVAAAWADLLFRAVADRA